MAVPAKIEFRAADGTILKGILYDAGEKRPTIIMSNGFTGTKEAYLPSFAERFHAAGFTVVIYDNRNWGESEGLPRNESDPTMQIRDYLAAFDYAAALPSVDASNVVYWGTSLSGGNAICAGALDQRIRAVISQVPFASGEMVTMGIGQRKAGFVLADRAKLARGEASMMIPVVPNSIEEVENGTSQAVLSTTDIFPFLAELDRRGVKWEKFSTMQSLFYMQSHEPIAYVHRISPRPLLMVVGEHDECIPTNLQLKMFARAQEPKQVHVIRDAGHFDPYYGEKFEENIRVQLEFLWELFGKSA